MSNLHLHFYCYITKRWLAWLIDYDSLASYPSAVLNYQTTSFISRNISQSPSLGNTLLNIALRVWKFQGYYSVEDLW